MQRKFTEYLQLVVVAIFESVLIFDSVLVVAWFVAFVSIEGNVVVVDNTKNSASNPRATVCPGWNITDIWFPVEN